MASFQIKVRLYNGKLALQKQQEPVRNVAFVYPRTRLLLAEVCINKSTILGFDFRRQMGIWKVYLEIIVQGSR